MFQVSAAVAASQHVDHHPNDLRADAMSDGEVAPAYRFRLRAVSEPSVLPRVVEMFTLRDLIPHQVHCHICPGVPEEMELELVVATLTADQARTIAARMDNLVPVLRVSLHEAAC